MTRFSAVAVTIIALLAATAAVAEPASETMMGDDHGPGIGIRYRTHVSGPIAPVNRQLSHRQQEASRNRDDQTNAGIAFDDWTFDLGSSWTWIQDDFIGADAMAREYFVTANATVGDTLIGASLAYDRFTIDARNVDMQTIATDFYALHPVAGWLDLGIVSILSHSAIARGPGAILTIGAGPVASAHYAPIDALTLGLTSSINYYDVDGNYDVLFTALFDANYHLTDALAVYSYATYNDSQRDTPDDRSFWTIGAQLSYAPNDRINVTVGYETTRAFDRYDDDTLLLSATFAF